MQTTSTSRWTLKLFRFVLLSISLGIAICNTAQAGKPLVLGFSQVGAEGDWRKANTISIHDSAAQAGIDLRFADAEGKQENQIKAIRSFIAQKVDVIAFSPVVESGWETVLREARAARIPVVLTDRSVDVRDRSLYVTFLGSDFESEGRKAGKWLIDHYKQKPPGIVNVVELQGTSGSGPAVDRKIGFEKTALSNSRFRLLRSQSGDFTRAKGKEVMEGFLKAEGKKINVVFAHNDDMALGAIAAIEEAGMKPGTDILIVSVDAVKAAFEAMIAGKMNVTVECNPLIGPQLMKIVADVSAGKALPKRITTVEGMFPMEVAAQELAKRRY